MFLGYQKIDYDANYCNIDPKEKGILEFTIVGNTSSCGCRTGIDYPKLRMEEEEEYIVIINIRCMHINVLSAAFTFAGHLK
jgi:hypothetical protein